MPDRSYPNTHVFVNLSYTECCHASCLTTLLGPFVPLRGKCNAAMYKDILLNCVNQHMGVMVRSPQFFSHK